MRELVTRLLGRLKVSRKLMRIYLLDLTAVIYISSVLINEKYIAINFARKEVVGNAYAKEARDALLELARLTATTDLSRAAATATRAQQALRATEARLGSTLDTAEPHQFLQASLLALQQTNAEGLPGMSRQVLKRGGDLLTRVANQSNLILDPDLDSYYTMSLTMLRYPELLELLGEVGERVAQTPAAPMARSTDAQSTYLVLEGRLDAVLEGIRLDTNEASSAGQASLGQGMRGPHAAMQRAFDQLRVVTRALNEGGRTPTALASVRLAQVQAIDALRQVWQHDSTVLDQLLDLRINNLLHRMWLHLGTALALLLTILGIVTLVARSIATPLSHLANVADTVRRTGDHSLRAKWHSADEIGRLVAAFNDMLDKLIIEREAQKELAASARAAEAQRAMVERMPIALVVTSVPGQEVLHANPSAANWLNGLRTDPWQHSLDKAARARFFQQIADRGEVNEFEVQWRQDNGSNWAVLSAQRAEFDGQDAIITAFTPINHLKVMERRLELWAKVFEASSEGIMILDADQRLLTINRAMTRATGYELADVLGEPLKGHFFDESVTPELPAVWASVTQRGHWSGELTMCCRDGRQYPAWVVANGVRNHDGSLSHTIILSMDITDRKESEARIRYLAEHDVLTKLPNRALCTERLRLSIQQARRSGDKVAVIFIDLDRFKDINDTLGHHMGDGLLRSVSQCLLAAVREGDTVSRLGGDEFVVVLGRVQSVEEVADIVEQRLLPGICAPHRVDDEELQVSGSVGIAIFPDHGDDIDTLMRHADAAMYETKAAGRNGARFFTAEAVP